MRLQTKRMMGAFLLLLASAPAWAHPVTTHQRDTTIHDRAPQPHEHGAATRAGR